MLLFHELVIALCQSFYFDLGLNCAPCKAEWEIRNLSIIHLLCSIGRQNIFSVNVA